MAIPPNKPPPVPPPAGYGPQTQGPNPAAQSSAGVDPAAQTTIGQAQTYSNPGGFLPQSNINFGGGQYAPLADASTVNLTQLQRMLMSQANGGGPNIGQMQLQSATDQNIRNAMALGQSMPGQSNMAAGRNILENQAMAQQQAAGQSAMLDAQQQLAAEQQLGQLGLGSLGTAGGLMTDAQKLALQESQGNQVVAMQGVNAGMNIVGNVIKGGAGALQTALAENNNPSTGGADGGGDVTPATPLPDTSGAGAGDVSPPSDVSFAAHGGIIPTGGMLHHILTRHYATGGEVDPNQAGSFASYDYEPPSQVGGFTPILGFGANSGAASTSGTGDGTNSDLTAGLGAIPAIGTGVAMSYRGINQALKNYDDPNAYKSWDPNLQAAYIQHLKDKGQTPQSVQGADQSYINSLPPQLRGVADFKAQGGSVPGRAAVKGDSSKNDTVPAMLSPGEGVVPRSAMKDEDKAAAFIRMVVRQHKQR